MIKNLLLSSLLLVNLSCSMESVDNKDVNENQIYQEYTISYDQADQTLTMIAQFLVGGPSGTTVKLVEPSKIELDGVQLDLGSRSDIGDLLSGSFYRAVEQNISEPNEKYIFKWTLSDGSVVENVVYPAKPIEIDSIREENISQSEPFEVTFSGHPERYLTCDIISLESQENEPQVISTLPVGNKCVFSKDSLLKLPLGKAYIEIVNNTEYSLTSVKEVGGKARSYYYAKKINVNITN